MNQEQYRKLAHELNHPGDIDKVARDYGIERELALIIYTQRITRDATSRFYVVKNQIARIASLYDKGTSLVELAGRHGFPPVLLGYLLFLHKGMPRKQFWQDVRNPEHIRDARLRKEISAAVEDDMIYSPRGEEVQRERGHRGERWLFEWLDRRNIKYMTEHDLKKLKDYTKTPDALFMKPMVVAGKKTAWIESKANFGDVVEIKRNLKKQLLPYVKLFGPGIVVYWYGYVSDIEPPEGVTLVDANFFREAHPAHGHHAEPREHAHAPSPEEARPHHPPAPQHAEPTLPEPPRPKEDYIGE
jgi:CDAN1-interacting nuclease 1